MKTKTFDVMGKQKKCRFCYGVEFINFSFEIENSEIPGSFLFDKFLEGGHKTHTKYSMWIILNNKIKYKKKFRQKKNRKHIL